MEFVLFFLFSIVFAINCLIIYFRNFEDQRKDLGGFGGKNGTD